MESGGEWWTASWRCINCGYVLDPVLEQNRRNQQLVIVAAPAPQAALQEEFSEEELTEFDAAA